MVRSPLFWKLFLGFCAINLLTALALVTVSWGWYEEFARTQSDTGLRGVAALAIEAAPEWIATATPVEQVSRFSVRTGVRVVVVDVEGTPLSGNQSNDLALAAARDVLMRKQEVWSRVNDRVARAGDTGPMSDIYAIPVLDDQEEIIGALAFERLDPAPKQSITSLGRRYGLVALFSGLLVLGVGYALVVHIVHPVRLLNRAALAMAAGDYGQRAFVPNRDELGALARAFNSMGRELGRRLSELRDSDRRQATVLGGMIEGVVAIDDNQQVLFANAAAGRLFDFRPLEVEGRPLLEVVRHHALHQAVSAVISSRRPQRLEIEWAERNLSVQATPLVGDPAAGVVVVLHDTTELRRLETLRRDFVANVSHELKTPLSSIKAYSETLRDGAMDDEQNRTVFLERIVDQADRLDDLIRDMLNLARIESANQPFEIKSVLVNDAASACLRDYLPRAEAKKIRLWSKPPEGELGVKADPEGLRVILGNLVDNAIKYTPEGGDVCVRWGQQGAGELVCIDVVDSGVGIPREKLDRVFERFFRVDEARSRDLGGTGLGLSIVKHLAQSFGGSVAVTSEANTGSTFSVTLPGA